MNMVAFGSSMCLGVFLGAISWPSWGWLNRDYDRIRGQIERVERQLAELPERPTLEVESAVGIYTASSAPNAARWMQVDLGEARSLDSVVLIPAYIASTWAYGFPLAYRVEVSLTEGFEEPILLWEAQGIHSPKGPIFVPAQQVRCRYVRVTATTLVRHPLNPNRLMFCLGEILAFSGGRNVALRRPVSAPGAAESLPPWSVRHVVDGSSPLGVPVERDERGGSNGWHSAICRSADREQWVQVDLGAAYPIEEVRLIPARPLDFMERPGFGFPVRFRVEISEESSFAQRAKVFDTGDSDFLNPGGNALALAVVPVVRGRYVRVTATRLWQRMEDYVFALGELEVVSGKSNVARGKRVEALEETVSGSWSGAGLVDGRVSTGGLVDEQRWLWGLATRAQREEEREVLRGEESAARAVAERRGLWVVGGLGIGVLGWSVWLMGSARRMRRREIRELREQIARDLHDDIGSTLGSIALRSALGARREDPTALREIHRLAAEASASMRGILWMVRENGVPSVSQLVDALREHAAQALGEREWTFEGQVADGQRRLDLAVHRNLFLVVKEALHNVVKHADATQVRLAVRQEEDWLEVVVEDNGKGFDPNDAFLGSGLANMQHRVQAMEARLGVESVLGRGTRVRVEVPIKE